MSFRSPTDKDNLPDKQLEDYTSPSIVDGEILNRILPPRFLSALAGKTWKMGGVISRMSVLATGAYGRHINRFRHDGYMPVEFSQHRQYSPGDEMRYVDWKIYGRKERFFVKQFQSESVLRYYVVLDASASMGYPYKSHITAKKLNGRYDNVASDYIAGNKLLYAVQVAAGCAYVLISQGDSVGFVAGGLGDDLSDESKKFDVIPPSRGWNHFNKIIIPRLAGLISGGEDFTQNENLGGIFETRKFFDKLLLGNQIRKNSPVIFISDLMRQESKEDIIASVKLLASHRHHCLMIHIIHPDELYLPPEVSKGGDISMVVEMEDSETHSRVEITSEIAEEYRRKISDEISFYKSLEADSRGWITYHTFKIDVPVEKNFLKLVE